MTFDQLLEIIRSQPVAIVYGILFLSAFIENLLPPFPGDAVILAGAYLAGVGNITYIGVLLSAIAGGMTGAMTLYAIGSTTGRKFFETGRGRFFVKDNLQKTERLFNRYGSIIIMGSRFLAGVRSAVSISAGIVKYDIRRMLIFTGLSFLIWYGLLIGLMIYSKSNWRLIVDMVKKYNIILIIIGAVILIVWIIRAYLIKRRNSK